MWTYDYSRGIFTIYVWLSKDITLSNIVYSPQESCKME